VVAAVTSGAFFMLGLSAWMLLKKSDAEFIKRSLKVALVVAFAGSVLQIATGHYHAIQVANTQPEKFATIEGVEKTEQSASAIIFGIPNEKERTINAAVRVPGLLSILLSGRTEHEVRGMEEFPPEDMPPLTLTFLSFHLMVALGFYFVLFSGLGIFLLAGKKIFALRSYLWLAVLTIPLPIVANELGWISAEVGRQPWAVYRVLKTVDAVSTNVSANSVLGSIAAFSVIYLLLFMAWIIVIRKLCTHFNQSGSV
jgi:cytochrome d ubiquinol oxidase subunit I